jgi:hypothetical protein
VDKRKYGYFRIDDEIIKPTDNDLTFEVTYYDSGTKPFTIQYNAISGTNPNYKKAEFTRTNSNTWISKSFCVTDAALDNKQNNQSDFRIMGEAYVRRVAVRIGTEDPEIPEIPVEYVVPQEPEDPTGTDQTELRNPDVEIGYRRGLLRVMVPEEMIGASLTIYNHMGQAIYLTNLERTEEMIQLSSNSISYIVLIQSGSTYFSKRILGF